MLDDPTHADITFIVEGEHRYDITIKLELSYTKVSQFCFMVLKASAI